MTDRPILDDDWIVGSINRDEDLHYSSYFLRAAVGFFGATLGSVSEAISAYARSHEVYLIRGSECETAATKLIDSALTGRSESIWQGLQSLHNDIVALGQFRGLYGSMPPYFANLTEALDFYVENDRLLRQLYIHARPFELLDRGEPRLTRRIRQCLAEELGIQDDSTEEQTSWLNNLLLEFGSRYHQNVEPVLGIRFTKLALEAANSVTDERERAELADNPGLAHQILSRELLFRLEEHLATLGFTTYHGYVRRRPMQLDDVLDALVSRMQRTWWDIDGATLPKARFEEKDSKLWPVPSNELRILVRLYGDAANLKLMRRLAQLKLFPLLDEAFSRFAEQTGSRERDLRYLLPEEIIAIVRDGDRERLEAAEMRSSGCVVTWTSSSSDVAAGRTQADALWDWASARETAYASGDLAGEPVFPGAVIGRVAVANRGNHALATHENYILVSEATDLDMLTMIQSASAVVTQRGGVTSHAATICRELRIPAVVGVRGLMASVRDGALVQVDGARGTVSVLD